MRVLLDTNIVIYRENRRVSNYSMTIFMTTSSIEETFRVCDTCSPPKATVYRWLRERSCIICSSFAFIR